ncbi:MAG: hypothetical protein RQ751_06585 [Longimicrobiales bacterium]|nr:hypothetical protein [Longimicrobiales bacterium]
MRPRRTRRPYPALLLPALVAALVAFAGCASGGRSASTSGPPIVIEVVNNHFQDATVIAFRETERERLGIVTGKTERSFAVPWGPNLFLRLEVNFIGGGACATQRIQMDPGQRYVLELQPDIRVNAECRPIGG